MSTLNWSGPRFGRPQDFFLSLYPQLYSFVSRHSDLPHHEVEDIVQETLLHAWRDRASFEGRSDPATWVIAIARNRMRDHFRSSVRRRAAMERFMSAFSRLEESRIPGDLLETDEFKAHVMEALGSLDPKAADLLFRYYYDRMAVKDIAAASGDSEDAVESRLRRAKSSLMSALQGGGRDGLGS